MSVENIPPEEQKTEPCPTPLAWQEVAQAFHETAESRIISTDRADLKVTEFGVGRPIVFLPAMCGSSRLFCLTAWLLKDEFRTILIESPQFRKRPGPKSLVRESAETYSMALEHLCPDGADIYASTFSSQVAIDIMSTRPKVIRSAMLQGAWANRQFTATEQAVLQLGRFSPFQLKRMAFWQSTQIENHRRWFPPFDETRFGFLLQEVGETATRDLSLQLLASQQTDLRPVLKQIHQPVLVLHCEGEGVQIAAAEGELERQLPNVQREEMYHSGHFPYLTHPNRLIKIMKPFLKKIQGEE